VAHCLVASGEREAGEKSYREALEIYRGLVRRDPSHIFHQRNLALTLERLGEYGEALKVKRAVVAGNPDNPRPRHDLASALINMGDQAYGKKDWAGALDRFDEALTIARALVKEDPANTEWQDDLVDSLYRVGNVYAATKRPADAKRMHEESLDVARRLAEKDPDNAGWQRGLALALERLGRHAESIEIRRKLLETDPNNLWWRREFVWVLGHVGDKTSDAALYEEALPVHRGLPESASQQRELSYCLYRIGTLHETAGDLETALVALREAESVHRGAKGHEKEHKWWADAYFRVCYNAACAAAKAGDSERALRYLAENLKWARKHVAKQQLTAHLEHARVNDPDLKSLRGTPEFDALFR
jgi:tetratricopeptide (TPR) repeat protein